MDYYPLEQGLVREYAVAGIPVTLTNRVTGKEDGLWVVQATAALGEQKSEAKQYLKTDETGVKLVKVAIEGKESAPSEPQVLLKFPVKKGTAWAQTFDEGDEKTVYKGSVVGEETVKVTAGEFTAYKVETSLTANHHGTAITQKTTQWYAPKVGMVRLQMELIADGESVPGLTWELVRHGKDEVKKDAPKQEGKREY
jgi:hypothetical protein